MIAHVKANARALLSADGVALNLMGHLSGIATLTRAYVEAVAGTGATITDTRKTTPACAPLRSTRCAAAAASTTASAWMMRS